MKNKLILAIAVLITSCDLSFGQFNYKQGSDSFFTYNYKDSETYESGLMSSSALSNVEMAPIGSSWLLLAGMGVAYGIIRRKSKD